MVEEVNDILDVDIAKALRKLRFFLRLDDLWVMARRPWFKWQLRRQYPLSQMYDVYLWCKHLYAIAPQPSDELDEENALLHAILGIHARALKTAWGAIVLLREGLADEAYARSRTVDELWITAEFLQEHPTAAFPYCLHEAVDNHDMVRRFPGHWQDEAEYEKTYDEFVKDGFIDEDTHPRNGWAAKALGKKAGAPVPFTEIREAVEGIDRYRSAYSQASQQVHANRVGLLGLESPPDGSISLRGSGFGLGVPMTNVTSGLVRMSLCAGDVYGKFGEDELEFEEMLITWNLGQRVWNNITPTNPTMESSGD